MSQRNKLGFGCVALTTYRFKSNAIKMLELAYSNGITNYDTAPLYGRGYSEEILGSFIKNKRNKIVVTTKVGLGSLVPNSIPAKIALPLNAIIKAIKRDKKITEKISTELPKPITYRKIDKNAIEQFLQLSLKRLNSNYIDNYFLHEALPSFITDEGWQYLEEMKSKGIILNIGVATSFVNLKNIELSNYPIDFLQYENNFVCNSDDLIIEFKNLKHNYHSVLKYISLIKTKEFSSTALAGILLNNAVRKNTSDGYVLFSTTNKERLIVNLKEFDKYDALSTFEFNDILKITYSTFNK